MADQFNDDPRQTGTEFRNAFQTAGKLKDASQDEQLQLYAYAKIARGFNVKDAPNPGFTEFAKKAMKRKWQEETDKGTTPEEAEKKYVELFTELKNKNGLKP
ncbi:diazepam-binding inhibitor [Phyllosticta capitalensis]|uniref:Diazepam-binding inhibitor n=2 Tax=Phyllosticta capitalensis TaxID=121624 RepID=A0ABR1Z0R7_9PEZI